jgi:5-formyltetrahydrofolate cyclo-ligase
VGTYAWYTLYRPCEVNTVEQTSALLVSQMKRYDHAYQFAATASRNSLVRPVGVLQQILMDTQEVLVPAYMQTAKTELISYMDAVIRAFQAFGALEPDETIRGLKDQSETHYDNFSAELEVVNKCAPFCIP